LQNLVYCDIRWRLLLILEMTVFLPVWNSHCTRVRFTVTVSCSDELAVHSCPSAYGGGLRKSRADCSAVGVYCVTMPLQQSYRGSLYIKVAAVLPHGAVARRHIIGRWCSETATADGGKIYTLWKEAWVSL